MQYYFEIVLSMTVACVCWYTFGWRLTGLLTGILHMYKSFWLFYEEPKLKQFLTPTATASSSETSLLNAPVTRTQFNPRTGRRPISSEPCQSSTWKLESLCNFFPLTRSTKPVCCSACEERKKTKLEELEKGDLINCLDCDTHEPHNPWYIRRFGFLVRFWRIGHIGPQFHMVSLKDMMGDERVNHAIEEVAMQELAENPNAGSLEYLIKKHKQRAEKIISNMRAKQPKHPYYSLYVRFASWIIGKTLSRVYPRILTRKSQLERIQKARESGYRIIYLPVHRSHMDYVLVSWVLAASGFRSPLVAAGDNLNIPVFNLMMKSVGGFFVRRRLDCTGGKKDVLYRAILVSYMERSILDDNDLEFFVEGGRTRTGKPCHPKGGLLNIAIDTMLSKKVEDLLIVPVNFTYEKLLEGNYIREQLGKPKVNESFASAAVGLWNSMQHTKFGNARIDFGRPFSVKEFIASYKEWTSPARMMMSRRRSSSSNSDSDPNNNNHTNGDGSKDEYGIENRRDFIDSLAQHVLYDGVQQFSLMSTNIIAFLLLNKFRQGVSVEHLAEEMQLLKEELILRNHDVDISGDMKAVIDHGLTVLGPSLVMKSILKCNNSNGGKISSQTILKPVTSLPNVIDLAYYSTCVTPIYALDSVIATSLLYMTASELKTSTRNKDLSVTDLDLIYVCLELCDILHPEFIFKPPCQTMPEAIRKTVERMRDQGLIRTICNLPTHEDSDEEIDFSKVDLIYVSSCEKTLEKLRFLHGLIRPILDTYSVSSFVLKRLVGCEAEERQLHMDMLAEVKCHLRQNFITHGESLALDPIRNFVKVLTGWKVLESSLRESTTIYNLGDSFDNEGAVYEIIRKIGKFQV